MTDTPPRIRSHSDANGASSVSSSEYSSSDPSSSGLPVDMSTYLLTNLRMHWKDARTYYSGLSRVNDTYTIPGDVAEESVGMGMMKSSVSPESACGCMMTDTCSSTVSGIVLDTLN